MDDEHSQEDLSPITGTFSEDNAAGDMDLDFPLPQFPLSFSQAGPAGTSLDDITQLSKAEYERAAAITKDMSGSGTRPASLDFESLPGPSHDETPRHCLSLNDYFLDDSSSSYYNYGGDTMCGYLSTSALYTMPRRPKHRRHLTYPTQNLWPQNSVGSSTRLSDCTPSQSNGSMDESGPSNYDYSKAPRTPDSEVFEPELPVPIVSTHDLVVNMRAPSPPPNTASPSSLLRNSGVKPYDYLLKFLLVGDSDVGKHEMLDNLEDENVGDTPFTSGPAHKTTTLLLDGRRVRLQVWDTSGQGRFCTVLRSYSRGAQGVLLVFDLTNRWSFDGLDRWLKEIENHAPGVPKVLVGNRLHLEFRRAVQIEEAEQYARRHGMSYFEISPLCNYNVMESFGELARRALRRNGMERLWRAHQVPTLQELCCRSIVSSTSVYGIDKLPLPGSIRTHLRSYAVATAHSRVKLKSKSFRKKKSILGSFNQTCVGKKKMCSLM